MGKHSLKRTLISILAAIVFVGAVFLIIMVVAKPYFWEEPWEQEEAVQTDEIKLEKVKTMYVSAEDGLAMYAEPGDDQEAMHMLIYGQEVQVKRTENGWARISADGLTGWCSAVKLSEEQVDPLQKEIKEVSDDDRGKLVEPAIRIGNGFHGIVNTDGGLNLRCGPGQDYDILMVVPYKTEVVEEGRDGDWLFINYDGQYGWVNLKYITPLQDEKEQ